MTSNKLTFCACRLPAGLCISRVSFPCLPGILQLTALTSLRSLDVDVTFIDDGGYCDSSCRGPVRVRGLGTGFRGFRPCIITGFGGLWGSLHPELTPICRGRLERLLV